MAPTAPQRLNQRQAILFTVTVLLVIGMCAVFFLTRTPPAASVTGARGVAITAAELGEAWPLSVAEGTLVCDDQAITFRAGGQTYAVNGTAKSRAQANGWRAIEDLSVPTPDQGAGTIKSLQPLVDRGLALCP